MPFAFEPTGRYPNHRFLAEISHLLESIRWGFFCTFTFRGQHRGQLPGSDLKDRLSAFLEEWGRKGGIPRRYTKKRKDPVAYIAWERQQSGEWHAHALVRGVNGLLVLDEGREIAHRRLGLSRIQAFDHTRTQAAISYVLKTLDPGCPQTYDWFGEFPEV